MIKLFLAIGALPYPNGATAEKCVPRRAEHERPSKPERNPYKRRLTTGSVGVCND